MDEPQARVLHVFNQVCNLIAADNKVLAIVTSPVGNGPFSLLIPAVTFCDHVSAGSRVEYAHGLLLIDELKIDTRPARDWNPCPPWGALHQEKACQSNNLKVIFDVLNESSTTGSLANLIIASLKSHLLFDKEILQQANAPARDLVHGLRTDNQVLCCKGAAGLAGLGGGLTPSGDDWIVGCLLATWASKPKAYAKRLSIAIANAAVPQTTSFSAAWIHSAAHGECSAAWHILFEELIDQNQCGLRQAAERIAAQGHTSGIDALSGFAAVLSDKWA